MGLATADSPVQITNGEKHDCDPAVSPDGKRMVFASDRTGPFNLYLMTFSEAGVVQLTQSPKDDRNPAWSADGKLIVFDSRRTGSRDLYEMAPQGGSGFLQLSDSEVIEEFPSYTKAGGLLYTVQPSKMKVRQHFIMISPEKSGLRGATQLTEGNQPRLAPDGTKIVFVSQRTKNKDIWIMSADGGLQTQLTTDSKDDEDPCFSPDGKQIVFASKRTGNHDLWAMNVDGTNVRQLTSGEASDTQPCWGKDGNIYFTRAMDTARSSIFRMAAP